jgi:hypothetical protein
MNDAVPTNARHHAGSANETFRAARDFLLQHRTDYAGAMRDFTWPQLDRFNWALDWFDVIARANDRPALLIVEEDGSQISRSFAEMAQRSNRIANWLREHGVARGDRGAGCRLGAHRSDCGDDLALLSPAHAGLQPCSPDRVRGAAQDDLGQNTPRRAA